MARIANPRQQGEYFSSIDKAKQYNKHPLKRQYNKDVEISHLTNIFENKNSLAFSFYSPKGFLRVLYLKDEKHYICFRGQLRKYFEEQNGVLLSLKTPSLQTSDELLRISKLKLGIVNKQKKGLSEESNPIVVFSKLKDF